MATKLIKLENGTLVEVYIEGEQVQQMAGGIADKVDSTFASVKKIILETFDPIVDVFDELEKKVDIEQIDFEIGVGFESEGNLYITRSKMDANLCIKLVLKPKKDE